jgi:SAM-dependent methyltransferase
MLITEEYRGLNKQLHVDRPDYGAGTATGKHVPQIRDLASALHTDDILDYGCGKGHLARALSHMIINEYDPAMEGKDAPPAPAGLVVCLDVMEHVEPGCLDDVLDDLLRCTLKGIFLTVATRPAMKTLADGRNAHLIQEPPEWWLPKIMARWDLRLFQAVTGEFAIFALKHAVNGNGKDKTE